MFSSFNIVIFPDKLRILFLCSCVFLPFILGMGGGMPMMPGGGMPMMPGGGMQMMPGGGMPMMPGGGVGGGMPMMPGGGMPMMPGGGMGGGMPMMPGGGMGGGMFPFLFGIIRTRTTHAFILPLAFKAQNVRKFLW